MKVHHQRYIGYFLFGFIGSHVLSKIGVVFWERVAITVVFLIALLLIFGER